MLYWYASAHSKTSAGVCVRHGTAVRVQRLYCVDLSVGGEGEGGCVVALLLFGPPPLWPSSSLARCVIKVGGGKCAGEAKASVRHDEH
jgi:hypothetical protein